jgi:hypothetical protein
MVEPVSDEERQSFYWKLKVGVAVLVGVSGGLVALQTGTTFAGIVGVTAASLLLGAGLAWLVIPEGADITNRPRSRPDPENPFEDDTESQPGDDRRQATRKRE